MTITDEMIERAARAIVDSAGYPANMQIASNYARAALTAVLPMLDGWQDISTAPKDGSWFVIVNQEDGTSSFEVGCYDPSVYHRYEPVDGGLFKKVYDTVYEWRSFNNFHRATDWRPLPPPPKGDGT